MKHRKRKKRARRVGLGVFFIGLAVLFVLETAWWPGILFVLAFSMIARTLAAGKRVRLGSPAFWLILIGIIFGTDLLGSIFGSFGNIVPWILIGLGLFLLLRRGGKKDERVIKKKWRIEMDNDDDEDVYHV